MKTIVFSSAASKDLDALPERDQLQVTGSLEHYAISGEGDVTPLTGRGGWRLRVGRYRVIFDEDKQTILAIYIGKRETTTYRRH